MTSTGIEPGTFWLVAQHLNHCATAVPSIKRVVRKVCRWKYSTLETFIITLSGPDTPYGTLWYCLYSYKATPMVIAKAMETCWQFITWWNVFYTSSSSSSSSSVICQTTGPKAPPKRFLHTVQSRASSFNWQNPFLSLRSSSSFLRLLPRLLVTSICPFIFPSITCRRRQFLRKMWPIQLSFCFLFYTFVDFFT